MYPITAARRKKQEHTAPTIIPADNSAGIPWNEVVLIWQFSSGRKILDSLDGGP